MHLQRYMLVLYMYIGGRKVQIFVEIIDWNNKNIF